VLKRLRSGVPLDPPAAGGAADGEHRARCERLLAALNEGATAGASPGAVGLGKTTSNLFRDRVSGARRRLDVRALDHVLQVNAAAGWVDAEGMVPYDVLVDACLAHGVLPAVVPQLKSITLGGAVAGVGIEATSFRHGFVHETMSEIDVLVGDGRIVAAAPDNAHAALFHGFANSYGTLGYALRLRVRTIPAPAQVMVRHQRFSRSDEYFAALADACQRADLDFVDGVAFDAGTLVLSTAQFMARTSRASDYTFRNIYYRSLLQKETDYLTTRDYIWRWDTDWFWCSKNVGAQNPLLRPLFGRARLNSRTYTRIMRWNSRIGLARWLARVGGRQRETVIQDVDIPIAHAAEFLNFFLREVGITPVWICPIGATASAERWPLYPRRRALYVNFGFWDVVRARHAPGHFNRLIERKVVSLAGIKSLYSDSFFERSEFDELYGGAAYERLKSIYDPAARLGDRYAKCVLRQ